MRVMRKWSIGCLSLVLGCVAAWPATVRVGPVYSSGDRVEMQVETTVPLKALASANVWLVEDGARTVHADSLKPAREAQHGLAAMIAVDVSGSMKGAPLDDTKNGVRDHLGDFAPADTVALVSFASDVKVESDFGPVRRPELLAALSGLQSRGKITLLYDTLVTCIDRLKKTKPLRRRVIVISDGMDEKSKAGIDAVIRLAREGGVAIDGIGRGTVAADYSNSLYRLAAETGGIYVYAGAGEISEKIKSVVEGIENMPVAVFDRKVNPAGAKTSKIAVELGANGSAPVVSEDIAMIMPATLILARSEGSPVLLVVLLLFALLAALAIGYLVWRKNHRNNEGSADSELAPLESITHEVETKKDEVIRERASRRGRTETEIDVGRMRQPQVRAVTPNSLMLRVRTGPLAGEHVAMEAYPFRVGAGSNNDLPIPDDDWLSNNHAFIQLRSGRITVQDVGSTNGTYVNGQKIDAVHTLAVGDVVRVGRTELELVEGQERHERPRTADPLR